MSAVSAYASPFALGDRVTIGDDTSVVAIVTAVLWRTEAPQIEVSWMNGGALNASWVAPMMLKPAPEQYGKAPPLRPTNGGVTPSCVLRTQGKAYPRTCPKCGLGPCTVGAPSAYRELEPV